jgi:uncharacterized membrane protein
MNRRIIIITALAAIGLLVLGGVVFDRVFLAPGRAAKTVATAKAGETVAEKRGEAARDTTRIIERHFTEKHEIERQVTDARAEIRTAPDAAAAHAAGVAAVCMLAPPAGGAANPACALPGYGAGKPAG